MPILEKYRDFNIGAVFTINKCNIESRYSQYWFVTSGQIISKTILIDLQNYIYHFTYKVYIDLQELQSKRYSLV